MNYPLAYDTWDEREVEAIHKVIENIDNDAYLEKTKGEVAELTSEFPLHKELDHEML